MRRRECLEASAAILDWDSLVVTATGLTYRIWEEVGGPGHIAHVNLGLCLPLGIGLALALPHRQMVVMDGDGSLIFNLSGLSDLGALAPPNLIAIVFDNEGYASCDYLPSASARTTDIESVARSCGVEQTARASELKDFKAALERAVTEAGPWLIVAKIGRDDDTTTGARIDGRENTYRFVRYIEQSEGIQIIKPYG